jgi:type II secretory pathway component PulM
MKTTDLINLNFIPHNRRKYVYPAVPAVLGLVFIILFSTMAGMTADNERRLQTLSERYDRIVPMVRELRLLQNRGGESLRPMKPLAAVQQISRDLNLEPNLASVRPMNLMGDQEGVQVLFESINLDQLVGLLTSLNSRAGLQVFSFNFNRRLDESTLANLQMVLTR